MKRPELGTVVGRALRLRCPRCGGGPLFARWLRMHDRCSDCGLRYERAPGYFLGSSYINYGVTALVMTFSYLVLRYGCGLTNTQLTGPLVAWVMIFPLLFFRHARALWLALDLFFDPSSFEEDPA